jgi:streptogramin lyase
VAGWMKRRRRRARGAVLAVACVAATLASIAVARPADAARPLGEITRVAAGTSPEGVAVGSDGNVWVTNPGDDTISRITPAGNVTTLRPPGISRPDGIVSGADGALWFASSGTSSIGWLDPVSGASGTFTAAGLRKPRRLALGADGNVWFTDPEANAVGRISPRGDIAVFSGPDMAQPWDLTAGPDGAVWFTNRYRPYSWSNASIGRITPTGVTSSFTTGPSYVGEITTGADGNLWFGVELFDHGWLARMTPSGVVTSFSRDDDQAAGEPQGLVLGPDGDVWFTRIYDTVGHISPSGVVTTVTDHLKIHEPSGIAVGPGGDLWFGNRRSDTVVRMTAALERTVIEAGTRIRQPVDIVTGPHGYLWFTNRGRSSVGRISQEGDVEQFRDDRISDPGGIALGSDGNLWFANTGGGSIGRLTPFGPLATFDAGDVSAPVDVAAAPDGSLWFVGSGDATIGRITTAGTVTTFVDDRVPMATAITAGPDGAMWFAYAAGGAGFLGRIAVDGTIMTFPTGDGEPSSVTTGPDGNLWVISRYSNGIVRMSPAGAVMSVVRVHTWFASSITTGPDGNLWFTGEDGVGRVTPAGDVTAFPSDLARYGAGITMGPDHNMWAVGSGTDSVVRIGTGVPRAPDAVTAVAGDAEAVVSWSSGGGSAFIVTASPGGRSCRADLTGGGLQSCTVTGLTNGTTYTFRVAGGGAGGFGPQSKPSDPVTPTSIPAAFHPRVPMRILDTRGGIENIGPYDAPWGRGETRTVAVAGPSMAVPSGARAVVLNVTTTRTTADSWVTVWPSGWDRPLASSSDWSAGETVPSSVTVRVGADGGVALYNAAGFADVVVDVLGWYDTEPGDGYVPVGPSRVLDSRPAGPQVGSFSTPWPAAGTRTVRLAGVGGIPADADAVVLNITVTNTTADGHLTVWPSGGPKPRASNLNWAAGRTTANAVTVELSLDGAVDVFNATGTADVIIDVVGVFTTGTGALFHPMTPVRIQDSRPLGPQVGRYATPWGPLTSRDVQVAGARGIPADATAVLLNVTATGGTAASHLTTFPSGRPAPLVSSLNWPAGHTVANAVTATPSAGGDITVRNNAGRVDVIADAAGWYG